jgi:hypothetical protein
VIGLLFLGLLAVWFMTALWLAMKATRRMRPGKLRTSVVCVITLILVTIPLTDEIIGGLQFKALCDKNAVRKVDVEKTKGKKIRVSTDPANKEVDGTSVRILYSRSSYRDVETNEELASSGRYVANGGWLIRTISTDNHIAPLTFRSTCGGGLELADYGLTLVK